MDGTVEMLGEETTAGFPRIEIWDWGKEGGMQVKRDSAATSKGPAQSFTGDVYVDFVASPGGPSRLQANIVHFTPGARTAWHSHPNGQTLYILEGIGRAQGRGGPVEVIKPGDRVAIGAGEEHWHGAAADRFMAHLSLVEVDEGGNSATWGAHVTDEEYNAAPES